MEGVYFTDVNEKEKESLVDYQLLEVQISEDMKYPDDLEVPEYTGDLGELEKKKESKKSEKSEELSDTTWSTGLCAFEPFSYLEAWVCPCISFAKINAYVWGKSTFWFAISVYTLVSVTFYTTCVSFNVGACDGVFVKQCSLCESDCTSCYTVENSTFFQCGIQIYDEHLEVELNCNETEVTCMNQSLSIQYPLYFGLHIFAFVYLILLRVITRTRLRNTKRIRGSICCDVLAHTCLPTCSLAQEVRESPCHASEASEGGMHNTDSRLL